MNKDSFLLSYFYIHKSFSFINIKRPLQLTFFHAVDFIYTDRETANLHTNLNIFYYNLFSKKIQIFQD